MRKDSPRYAFTSAPPPSSRRSTASMLGEPSRDWAACLAESPRRNAKAHTPPNHPKMVGRTRRREPDITREQPRVRRSAGAIRERARTRSRAPASEMAEAAMTAVRPTIGTSTRGRGWVKEQLLHPPEWGDPVQPGQPRCRVGHHAKGEEEPECAAAVCGRFGVGWPPAGSSTPRRP